MVVEKLLLAHWKELWVVLYDSVLTETKNIYIYIFMNIKRNQNLHVEKPIYERNDESLFELTKLENMLNDRVNETLMQMMEAEPLNLLF